MTTAEILQLLGLISAAEPAVLGYIKTLLESTTGMTGDEFLTEADGIWKTIKQNAQNELGSNG
jgi:hypothetical protein